MSCFIGKKTQKKSLNPLRSQGLRGWIGDFLAKLQIVLNFQEKSI